MDKANTTPKPTNAQKVLGISDERITKMSKQIIEKRNQNDAFFICNLEEISRKYREWTSIFPKITPFYAVKCNDHGAVLKTLSNLGIGFDCASEGEIRQILSLGVESNRIIYANPTKQADHIKTAKKLSVDLMTFDNANELHKIKKLYPTARLILRLKSDARQAKYVLGAKYGATLIESEKLLEIGQNLDLNIVGVSFHVGSGCEEPESFERAIRDSYQLFKMAKKYGFNFNILDIGGGFPGGLGNSLEPFGAVINNSLSKYFSNELDLEVIAEPGRFFVSSAFTLLTQIHSAREINDNFGETLSYMYYINESVFGSFYCAIFEEGQTSPAPLYKKDKDEKLYTSIVWGQSCDSVDKISSNVLLPKMEIGDWLIFNNMGDYSIVLRTNFNGYPDSKIYFLGEHDVSQNILNNNII